MGVFEEAAKEAGDAKHPLTFGAERLGVETVDWSGSIGKTAARRKSKNPAVGTLAVYGRAIAAGAKFLVFEDGGEFKGVKKQGHGLKELGFPWF